MLLWSTHLVWLFLAAAGIGFAIGLRFRVFMVFAAAVVLAAGVLAVGISSKWAAFRTLEVAVGSLAIQQLFYLIGLFVSGRIQKRGDPSRRPTER